MAPDPRSGERVYREIKQAILSGQFAIHRRLDIETLSSQFGVSATPVRYALAILSSERLVRLNASRLYQVAFWSERELHDLYQWRYQLARWALASYAPSDLVAPIAPERDYVGCYLSIMRHIDANANTEARRASRSADDRLQPALRFEKDVLGETERELARLAALLGEGGAGLSTALRSYFRRRITQSARIRSAAHASAIPDNGD
jgi:hypothetical protein